MKLALETCKGIINADWRKWDELASPEEFERWVKSRANHMATALQEALAEQPAQQEPVAWRPDVCPITGLPFFMWIEHHETGQNVPTYGGPYDSYTIPVRDKDGSYCRERYDHDLGGWRTDEVEDVGIQIVSDQAYVSDDEPPASKPWAGLPESAFAAMTLQQVSAMKYAELVLKEKNNG